MLDKNLRLFQVLFILLLLGLFFTSCKGRQGSAANTVVAESAESKALREKYALILGVDAEPLKKDVRMLAFIDEWYGVPYKYGGKDKSGVDCSSLTSMLLRQVFAVNVSGSAQGLYDQCRQIEVSDLKQGDLVFFKIESKKVSHVGVYITNNRFVHATTKKGVMINDLGEAYYKKYFFAAGKIRSSTENK